MTDHLLNYSVPTCSEQVGTTISAMTAAGTNDNVVYPPFRGKGYTDNYIGQLPLKYDGLLTAVDTNKNPRRDRLHGPCSPPKP